MLNRGDTADTIVLDLWLALFAEETVSIWESETLIVTETVKHTYYLPYNFIQLNVIEFILHAKRNIYSSCETKYACLM